MNKDSTILVLGSKGLVGSSLYKKLIELEYTNVIPITRSECNLIDSNDVHKCFFKHKPEYVFHCAGKVGGILANNNYPATFGFDNGMMALNIIFNCLHFSVKKLLFLGSSCIYPKNCSQPIKEEYLLTSELEPTNEMYALAKIFGLKLCQAFNKEFRTNFISCMPCNLYGPGDNFDLETSHVLPALIQKIYTAKHTNIPPEIWGTGEVYREFMYVDDLADACIFLMNNYSETQTINVGTGQDILIKDLVTLISNIIEYKGSINWDTSKPNGTYRKLLDVTRINTIGWRSKITLEEGLNKTYEWFKSNVHKL